MATKLILLLATIKDTFFSFFTIFVINKTLKIRTMINVEPISPYTIVEENGLYGITDNQG